MTGHWESIQEALNKKLIDVVRFFTYKSSGHISTRRLMKFSYLSELLFIERHGRKLSGSLFLSWDYGPWSPDLSRAIEAVEAECEDVRVIRKDTKKGNARIFQPTKSSTQVNLGKDGFLVLDDIFQVFGYIPTDIVIAFTKKASLFKQTQFGMKVDFESYHKARREAVTKLRSAKKGEVVVFPSLGYTWGVQVEDDGFSAENQDLPGCITEGDTLTDLEKNMWLGTLGFLKCEAELHETAS
jgi:hypothetical protein